MSRGKHAPTRSNHVVPVHERQLSFRKHLGRARNNTKLPGGGVDIYLGGGGHRTRKRGGGARSSFSILVTIDLVFLKYGEKDSSSSREAHHRASSPVPRRDAQSRRTAAAGSATIFTPLNTLNIIPIPTENCFVVCFVLFDQERWSTCRG